MDQIKGQGGKDDQQRNADGQPKPQSAPKKPQQYLARIEILKAISPNPNPQQPQQKAAENKKTAGQKLKALISSQATTNWLLVFIGIGAGIIAWRQNTLIKKANTISETVASTAAQALGETRSGSKTALDTAKALQESSMAAKETASATKGIVGTIKAVAEQNAKTAAATYLVAKEGAKTAAATKDVATESAKLATATEVVAQENAKTAKATEKVAEIAKQADDTSKEQLRAYVTVVMNPRPLFKVARDGQNRTRFDIEMVLRNSGHTPARNINIRVYCSLRRENADARGLDPSRLPDVINLADGGRYSVAMNGSGMTVGPGGEWPVFVLGQTKIESPISQGFLDSNDGIPYVLGRIDYQDVFGARHFTNFFYLLGPVATNRQGHEPIYGEYWNASN